MDEGQRPIYLDMQATTPVDPRVLDAMLPYYVGVFGNPHSRTHAYGWESEKAVEDAREHIAKLIGADPKEIIFTSGATESNNMSIKGVARFFGRSGKKKHIITSQTEHKCVLDSCRHLQDEGFEVTYLPVQNNGLINMDELKAAIKPETALVSIMAVNNEIGVIQPIEEIGKLCRQNKVFFHTDAAQAVGKIPLDVNAMNIDLMSISSHKIYGPKGIGACYVRRRPRVRIDPIISGGGQERGLRSGTLAPPLVVGFGEACRIASEEMSVCLGGVYSIFSPFPSDDLLYLHGFLNSCDKEFRVDTIASFLLIWNPRNVISVFLSFGPRCKFILTALLVRFQENQISLRPSIEGTFVSGAHVSERCSGSFLSWLRQRFIRLR